MFMTASCQLHRSQMCWIHWELYSSLRRLSLLVHCCLLRLSQPACQRTDFSTFWSSWNSRWSCPRASILQVERFCLASIVFESFLFLCLELQSRHLCFFLLLMSFSFLRIIYLANCFGSWMLSPIQFQSLNYCRFCDHRQIKPSTVPILSYVELLN